MRLISTLSPLPLESLEGYLERLRRTNHYLEPNWWWELANVRSRLSPNLLRQRSSYERLSSLTMLSVESLADMTLHRFVPMFHLGGELAALSGSPLELTRPLWSYTPPRTYVLSPDLSSSRRVCPLCWAEHRTLFLPWSLRHVTTCTVHKVLLVDRCVCGKPLRFTVSQSCCWYCGEDVGHLLTISIDSRPASLGLAGLISWALNLEPPQSNSEADVTFTHPPPGEMHSATLFRFLTHVYQLLARYDPDNPLFSVDVRLADWNGPPAILHEADVMHVHGALEVMWQLLTDWPNSWYSALARLAELEQREATVISRFPRALFVAPQLAGPEFRWLRLSYVDFVRSHVGKRPGVLRWYRAYPGLRRAWDESLPTLPELLSRQRVRELAQGEDKHVYDYFIEVEREAARQPIAQPGPEYENRSLMAEVVRPWTPTVG